MRIKLAFCLFLGALPLKAEAPLSAIEWLTETTPVRIAPENVTEPPVSASASAPDVRVKSIGEAGDIVAVGLLGSAVTGLPESLWARSDAADLTRAIATADFRSITALQRLLYTLLLAESVPPKGASAEAFLTTRADTLRAFGAIEPAEALVEGLPLASPEHFALWFDLTLLAGLEDKACTLLNAKRGLSSDYAAQIFCALRGEDWEGAAFLFDTADALGLLSNTERRLLLAFLDPEYAEDAPSLAPPRDISPLEFRLYEAVGNALPTASLPVAFAVTDLRELAGWKAQLEAAERLVRNGALSANVLLGLYTERKPSASGGVWERARAVQRLEAALEDGTPDVVSAALVAVQDELGAYGLTPLLAEIYVPELVGATLTPEGELLRFHLTLLSADYEAARPAADMQSMFLASLAVGAPEGAAALSDPLAVAIEEGFSTAEASAALRALLDEGKLGEAILFASKQMTSGLGGDLSALKSGIAGLRQMGLEDVVRRASLQMMLMKRQF